MVSELRRSSYCYFPCFNLAATLLSSVHFHLRSGLRETNNNQNRKFCTAAVIPYSRCPTVSISLPPFRSMHLCIERLLSRWRLSTIGWCDKHHPALSMIIHNKTRHVTTSALYRVLSHYGDIETITGFRTIGKFHARINFVLQEML